MVLHLLSRICRVGALVVLLAVAPYSSGTAQAEETACEPGYFSASGNAPCSPAPAGSFVATAGATTATQCSVGTYQDQTGQSSCALAPPGSFVDTTGATTANLCPAGTYQSLSGQTSCVLAGLGYFVPATGAVSQTLCPAGQTTLVIGATSCGPGTVTSTIRSFFGSDAGGARGLSAKAEAIVDAPNAKSKAGKLGAFNNQVDAKIGKPLTPAQGAILKALAALL